MVTHSNILAWRIPWTEEPGRLQSMGLQKSWTHLRDYKNSNKEAMYIIIPQFWFNLNNFFEILILCHF